MANLELSAPAENREEAVFVVAVHFPETEAGQQVELALEGVGFVVLVPLVPAYDVRPVFDTRLVTHSRQASRYQSSSPSVGGRTTSMFTK